MRFSCESCKAQLQIADEKVRGRRLIVRCKRCGAKIAIADPLLSPSPPRVVEAAPTRPAKDPESTRAMDSDVLERALQASRAGDGSANGSPLTQRFAAPAAPLPANPAVWFAMLQGKQTGPLTRAELETRANEGEVGPRTYIWCEGMESWQRAQEVLELTEMFPPLPAPPARSPARSSKSSAAAAQPRPANPQPLPAQMTSAGERSPAADRDRPDRRPGAPQARREQAGAAGVRRRRAPPRPQPARRQDPRRHDDCAPGSGDRGADRSADGRREPAGRLPEAGDAEDRLPPVLRRGVRRGHPHLRQCPGVELRDVLPRRGRS